MSKRRIIITRNEKAAIFVILFSKFSKFCISIEFMSLLFSPNVIPCLAIVMAYWIYCNKIANKFEPDYINAVERLIYHKIVSKIDKEDYDNYVREHEEYFK